MNSIVALPIAAAAPVASPSIAGVNDKKADELARLEQAIDLLRTRHISDGWKMDEVGAEQALRYFRAGCPDDDVEWAATLHFISSHGLSLDWICDGNVSSMICTLAAASRQAVSQDSKLLHLADEYVMAEQREFDLSGAFDRMDHHIAPPEALRIRPRDLELGRKLTFEDKDEFWFRPCDIPQWRNLMEYKTEWKETDDRAEMVQWKIQPSEELRARGAEIVAAWDDWYVKRPRGYKKAAREVKKAERRLSQIEREIANTRAATIEGMRAKIRCARAFEKEEIESIGSSCTEAMALSIFHDIQRLADA